MHMFMLLPTRRKRIATTPTVTPATWPTPMKYWFLRSLSFWIALMNPQDRIKNLRQANNTISHCMMIRKIQCVGVSNTICVQVRV